MFDFGFSKLLLIGVVALIVIGPERLPRVARTLGHLYGRLQRYVTQVKADINREMELDELRRLQREVKGAASEIEQSMQSVATDFQSGIKSVEQQLNEPASEAAPASSSVSEVPASAGAPPPEEPPRQPSLPGLDKV